jgi:hypothetical protein
LPKAAKRSGLTQALGCLLESVVIVAFDNDETEYLAWVSEHKKDGYVVNVDRVRSVKNYPMVHSASHAMISSDKIGNFTTGDYIKLCSTSLPALERFSESMLKSALTRCSHCMGTAA